MLPQEFIRAKRDGHPLAAEHIRDFIEGLVAGSVSEGQAAAFAMATFFRGLSRDECVALTRAMTESGARLSWDLSGPVVDKHSTGGIGDSASLVLAPIVAACGAYVPMIAGRGLGHTGGTLDKLDAIPGYRTQPELETFQRTVADVGFAIVGQTGQLAPADKRLYAIRDVTATVESIPLITASILSKKLAAGLGGLVMDVTTGNGAFMSTMEGAVELAETIRDVAMGAGLPTTCLISDMNQPLAHCAGNAIEVQGVIDLLTGRAPRDSRLARLSLDLAGEMLWLAGLADTVEEGLRQAEAALASGRAADCFARMVSALGGPSDLIERATHHLPHAPVIRAVFADHPGWVTHIDTRQIGLGVVELGGGRQHVEDAIDFAVGFSDLAQIGDPIQPGDPIGLVHARSEDAAQHGAHLLRHAYTVAPKPAKAMPLILGRLAAQR